MAYIIAIFATDGDLGFGLVSTNSAPKRCSELLKSVKGWFFKHWPSDHSHGSCATGSSTVTSRSVNFAYLKLNNFFRFVEYILC